MTGIMEDGVHDDGLSECGLFNDGTGSSKELCSSACGRVPSPGTGSYRTEMMTEVPELISHRKCGMPRARRERGADDEQRRQRATTIESVRG